MIYLFNKLIYSSCYTDIFSIDFKNLRTVFLAWKRRSKIIYCIVGGVAVATMVAVAFPGILKADRGGVYLYKNTEILQEYISNDMRNLYVTDYTVENHLMTNYNYPFKAPHTASNMLSSGWRVGDETQIQVKEKFHVKYLYREMTERDDIYYIMNPSELERMEEYFNNHYSDKGYKIVMTQQQIIDDCGIYSVNKVKI